MHSSKLESWIAFWIFEGKLQRFSHKGSWIFWKGHKMWPFLQDSFLQIIFYIRSGRPQFWIGGGLSIARLWINFQSSKCKPFLLAVYLRWAHCKQSPPLSSLVVGKSWRCQCDVIPHMSLDPTHDVRFQGNHGWKYDQLCSLSNLESQMLGHKKLPEVSKRNQACSCHGSCFKTFQQKWLVAPKRVMVS